MNTVRHRLPQLQCTCAARGAGVGVRDGHSHNCKVLSFFMYPLWYLWRLVEAGNGGSQGGAPQHLPLRVLHGATPAAVSSTLRLCQATTVPACFAPVAAIGVSHHNDGGVLRAGSCCLSRGVCPLLTRHPCRPPDAAFPLPVWVGRIEVCCDDCEHAGVPQLHCG
jgi:hypothetical protein